VPLTHRIPAFAYILQEPTRPGPLNAEKAGRLGAKGPLMGRLKAGHDVQLPNGTCIRAADVCGADIPGKRFAILQVRHGGEEVGKRQEVKSCCHRVDVWSIRVFKHLFLI
jgi:hypothetical protein